MFRVENRNHSVGLSSCIGGSCCLLLLLAVAWLRKTGSMFNLVLLALLEEWNSGKEEEVVFVTCSKAVKQSLQSLTFLFSSGLGKKQAFRIVEYFGCCGVIIETAVKFRDNRVNSEVAWDQDNRVCYQFV